MAKPTIIAVSKIGAAMVNAWKIMRFQQFNGKFGIHNLLLSPSSTSSIFVFVFDYEDDEGDNDDCYIPKLRTSDCTISDQPSTSTNSSSFSGSEMVIGGIIIMPMLISTVATTMSIRMNGT